MHNSTTQEVSPAEFASLKQLSFRHSQGLDAVYSNEAEAYIEQTTQKDSFKLLNKEEQQRLVFMMFVGIDSGSYWSTPENWNKWHALNGDSTTMVAAVKTTRGMAGPGASYWLTRKMMHNPRFRHTLLEDCIGCLLGSGSAVSWAIGGIVGSARAACE